MRAFLVTDVTTHLSAIVDFNTAACFAKLEPCALEYVLGEEGVCETDRYTIVDIVADFLPR